MGGVGKKKPKLGYEEYFCKVTYLALLEMLLRRVVKASTSKMFFHPSILSSFKGVVKLVPT
jgi:hypothetical protein